MLAASLEITPCKLDGLFVVWENHADISSRNDV
jgi:hypothetical protein